MIFNERSEDFSPRHLQTRTLSYDNGVAKDRLPLAVQARHLRIIVVEAADEHVKDDLNIGMQLELYGCYIGSFSEDGSFNNHCDSSTGGWERGRSRSVSRRIPRNYRSHEQ